MSEEAECQSDKEKIRRNLEKFSTYLDAMVEEHDSAPMRSVRAYYRRLFFE